MRAQIMICIKHLAYYASLGEAEEKQRQPATKQSNFMAHFQIDFTKQLYNFLVSNESLNAQF